MEKGGCIYIITNVCNTVLYIGVTSDLFTRITHHKTKKHPDSFAAKYNCNKLVYYEMFPSIEEAIGREKQLKKMETGMEGQAGTGFKSEVAGLIQ